jgi:hypothetical protein
MKGQVVARQQPNYRDMPVGDVAREAVAFGLTVSAAARMTKDQLVEYCSTAWHEDQMSATSPCGRTA